MYVQPTLSSYLGVCRSEIIWDFFLRKSCLSFFLFLSMSQINCSCKSYYSYRGPGRREGMWNLAGNVDHLVHTHSRIPQEQTISEHDVRLCLLKTLLSITVSRSVWLRMDKLSRADREGKEEIRGKIFRPGKNSTHTRTRRAGRERVFIHSHTLSCLRME